MVPPKQPQPCRKGRVELSRHFNLQLSSSLETDNPVAVSALVLQDNVLEAVEECKLVLTLLPSMKSAFSTCPVPFSTIHNTWGPHHHPHPQFWHPPSLCQRTGKAAHTPTLQRTSLIYLFGIYCSCVASQGNVYWMHFILFND